MKTIEVVAAIIRDDDKVLTTCRDSGEFKGMWEFPGGKIEANETNHEALHREILEELEVSINIEDFLLTINYDYPNFHLVMHCYMCTLREGEINLTVHSDAKWISKDDLYDMNWIPADIDVVDKLNEIL